MTNRSIRRLPDGELAVMQALWACGGPASGAELETRLQATHPMAATTVLTILTGWGKRLCGRREVRPPEPVPAPGVSGGLPGGPEQCLLPGALRRQRVHLRRRLCDSGLSREELAQLRQLLEEDRL